MKKHNGHSNGQAQSKVGHSPSGLQATLAKKIAHKLAQTAGRESIANPAGRPAIGSRRVDLKPSRAGTSPRILGNGHVQDISPLAVGLDAVAVQSSNPGAGYTPANASGAASIAVGNNAQAINSSSVGVGSGSNASGTSALALGNNAAATGNYSTYVGAADGLNEFTTGTQAFAGGYNVNASGNLSVAIGSLSKATTINTVALGSAANASGVGATALGYGAQAPGNGSIAIGGSQTISAVASVVHAIAIGEASVTSGTGSVAVGESASVSGTVSVAIGQLATATNNNAVALGGNSVTTADNSVSVGAVRSERRVMNMAAGVLDTDAVNVNQLKPVITALGGGASIDPATGAVTGPSYTLANGGVQSSLSGALGALDKAVSNAAGGVYDKYLNVKAGTAADDLNAQAGNSATALGPNANANAQSAVALGGNTVAGFNAIAIGTLAQGTGQSSSAVGLQAKASGLRSSTFGALSTASADSSTSMGHSSNASGVAATALGQAASAAGNYSVTVGIQASAVGSNTVVIGAGALSGKGTANVDGDGNIVIGSNALVDNTGDGAIAIGRNAKINNGGGDSSITGAGSIALGDGAMAYGNSSTAIGRGAVTSYAGGVALGDNAKVLSGTASVALGANTLADADMTVSVGNRTTSMRHRIVNMDAGLETYDAVNVNQLQPVVTALGGGAAIDPATGDVTGPTYTLANGGVQTTLSGALSALDKAVSDGAGGNNEYFAFNPVVDSIPAQANGLGAVAIGGPAYAFGQDSVALGMNSTATEDNTVSIGSVVIKRRIVNVARGDVSVTSTEAVTGAQLYETSQQLDALESALKDSGVIDPGTGDTLAVTYGTATKNMIPLGNAGRPVAITNVATAVDQTGAVNLSQLNGAMDTLRGELSPSIAYLKVDSTGADANASGADAVALGSEAVASKDEALAVGVRARAAVEKSVALGSDSLADTDLSVSIGNNPLGLKRRLVNMEAGAAADDAVSVSQLQPVVAALGGGAAIDPVTGMVTSPTYTFADGSVHTSLDAALDALDQAVSEGGGNNPYLAINSTGADAEANGNDAIGLGSGANASANNAVALGANSKADAADTVSVGAPGSERKIVNVAKGDVSATSTEAVTGSQLDETNQEVAELQDALTGSGLIDPVSRTSLAVTYSNANKNIVVLGGLNTPVEIMNVADGLVSSDAATVGQVTSAVSALRGDLSSNLAYVKVNSTGTNAIANGPNSVAIGSTASASETGSVAIGIGARATKIGSVALGNNSQTSYAMTVSVGSPGSERKIINVADGEVNAESKDAINGSQLFEALNTRATARAGILDVENPVYAMEGVTSDNIASLNGGDPSLYTALAFGSGSSTSGIDTVSFGLSAITFSDNAVALGSNSTVGGNMPFSVVMGSDAQVNEPINNTAMGQAVAVGVHVQANNEYALAVGSNSTWALGASSIAIGNSAKDRGVSGIAMGKSATVLTGSTSCIAMGTSTSVATNLNDAIAIGTNASVAANANGGVALGQGAVANRGNAVSLGATTGSTPVGTRQIINLSAGTQATDAVNVTQLQGVTSAIGGGAGVGADGSILPPSYMVGGTPYSDVGAAINAAANMVDPNAVSYDDTTKDEITFGGATGTLLTNVGAGNVTAGSADAINGSQLFGTAQSVATGLGSGAGVNPDGTLNPPLYVIGNTTADNVGEAFANLYTVINSQLADSGLVDQNGQPIAAVTYDGTLQNRVTLGGTGASAQVTVTNVAAGNVSSATSTDAVNGGQLFATNQQLDATDQAVSDLKNALDQGGVIDPDTGDSLAVTYADNSKTGIALGTAGTPVTVSNVNAGTQATDAVNIGQLQGAVSALGGGAGVGADGSIVPPSYVVDGKPYPDVGAALDAVASMTDANAVSYDDTTKNEITLGGTAGTLLTNVSAGNVTPTSADAINGSQLYGTARTIATGLGGGATVNPDGTVSPPQYVIDGTTADDVGGALTNLYTVINNQLVDSGLVDQNGQPIAAVTYDGTSQNSVTLGGAGATSPVSVSNVAPGDVSSATSTDAVNGGQLYTTNQAVTELADALDNSGVLDPDGNSLAVTYVDASKEGIALGAAGTPVTVSNVSAGTQATDAVNIGQLQAAVSALGGGASVGADGSIVPPSYVIDGTPYPDVGAALDAVASMTDANAVSYDDTTKNEITLGGTAGTLLTNVSAGNVAPTSADAINGSQLYGTAQTIANGLGGGATVNSDGTVTPPQYAIDGTTAHDVGDALTNLYTVINNQLADSGLVDQNGQPIAAVTYDGASQNSVTLGGAGATSPVSVSNVAPGDASSATSTDAVNGGQLYATNQQIGNLKDTLENSGLLDPNGNSLAVTYDDASKDGVTLGGAGASTPIPLHNMTTGTADTDGVNVAQLTTGLTNVKTELTSDLSNGAIDLKYIKVNSAGAAAQVNGPDTVAIGSACSATGTNGVAIGKNARAVSVSSVAIGFNSLANEIDPVVSVGTIGGERRIINVNDGQINADSKDAINGSQLYTLRKALDEIAATTRGAGVNDASDPVAAIDGRSGNNIASLNGGPDDATAAAMGTFSTANGINALAMGLHNLAGSNYSVALGYLAQTGADHDYSVAVGSDVQTNAPYSVAVGTGARANGKYSVALGSNRTFAIGDSSIAMGDGVTAYGENSIAIGRSATVARNVNDALALGSGASVTAGAIGSVALGHGAVADRGNAISIGGGSVGTRQVVHVSAGTEPNDAVNVAQLMQLKEEMAAMKAEIQQLRGQLDSRPAAH
ncbi:hypothetical protein [Dyella nitratireducens]|uniref:Membrane protein n=1 Tax=Dyella nitratireducens TaxID=1849580 RepID=A0ABQ1FKJ0_9GAMM|nr:hypothetical protein [Dyella nitratireducens]GGA18827.1 membrane protein [Dyella nitratireducens]GLQ44603.1 membrane protein [Dyella nitratireducens]